MGKGMYARNSERKTSRRESNSRYNFGASRKLKLLRAEHAELSAVFLPGTIGRPPFSYAFLSVLDADGRRSSSSSFSLSLPSFFHEKMLLLILSGERLR